jgi:pyruvate,orthophosphate dikinase
MTPDSRPSRQFVKPFQSPLDSPQLLGGKGASLAHMRALGLPIPPGFTITTEGWRAWRDNGESARSLIMAEVEEAIGELEHELGRGFGDASNPLLISVRSGAPRSMPGMMDTVLNLGLTDETLPGLAAHTTPDFAADVHVRLLSMFAKVVRYVRGEEVQAVDREDPAAAEKLKRLIETHSGQPMPRTAADQLSEAVEAVWRSWDSKRAKRYRRHAGISEDLGTAVTIQAMVFGNRDEHSGTGVVFTRDPATGLPGMYGDYLPRAQGEDVVAGGHNTEPLSRLKELVPHAHDELESALPLIEAAYRDMADVEFTVESGRLWILQARAGQRSGQASVRIAVDMVEEGLIEVDEAIDRIAVNAIEQLQLPVFGRGDLDVIGRGTPAAPGAGVGLAVFGSEQAQELAAAGSRVILIRPETSPEDIGGMIAAAGIVTTVGGRTSHAAVVARGLGRPAVCGVSGLQIDPGAGAAITPEGRAIKEGDTVAVDGTQGIFVMGEVKLVPAQPGPELARLLAWCDERVRLPIVEETPNGYIPVGDPQEATQAAARAVLVDVAWEGAPSQALLEQTVEAAILGGAEALALRIPDNLSGADLRPPTAPWTHLVSSPAKAWPARLLAARIPLVPTHAH